MDRFGISKQERQALQRFAAALLTLAGCCERVSYLPFPVRYLFLWLFRPAEAVLRGKIVDLVKDFGFWAELDPWLFHDNRADAVTLAQRFQALAELLEYLIGYADERRVSLAARFRLNGIERCWQALDDVTWRFNGLNFCAAPRPDT